jgi:hypothetical protein
MDQRATALPLDFDDVRLPKGMGLVAIDNAPPHLEDAGVRGRCSGSVAIRHGS